MKFNKNCEACEYNKKKRILGGKIGGEIRWKNKSDKEMKKHMKMMALKSVETRRKIKVENEKNIKKLSILG